MSESHKISINLSLAANYSKLSKWREAIDILEKGFPILDATKDFELMISYNLVSSDIYCRDFQYAKAMTILEKLKNIKKAPFRGRILFEYELLKAHTDEKFSLIKWPEAVMEDAIYSTKAKVIDYLLTGQNVEAQRTWIILAKKEPNNYLPNFEMKFKSDENTLYFVFIKKIQCLKIKNENIKKDLNLNGKQKILFDLLYQNKFPMRKEELIEKIWEVPYDPQYDSRFYKLVQRLKEKADCEIKNNHGGYLIE